MPSTICGILRTASKAGTASASWSCALVRTFDASMPGRGSGCGPAERLQASADRGRAKARSAPDAQPSRNLRREHELEYIEAS
jgi:hypothetical protein